jgi:hypothetical protein
LVGSPLPIHTYRAEIFPLQFGWTTKTRYDSFAAARKETVFLIAPGAKKMSSTSDSSVDGLLEGFGNLAVQVPKRGRDAGHFQPCRNFQNALDRAGLTIFKSIADLGYSGWKPKGGAASLEKASAKEIMDFVDVSMKPDKLERAAKLNSKLPLPFASLPPQNVKNAYPTGQYYIASLHAALACRGLKTSMVDFYFGGSTLEMLATQNISNDAKYLVALVPGTEIVSVVKHKEYIQNYSDFGFQFERFATGKSFRDKHDTSVVEHLQLLEIDGHRVFFAAEADAMDSGGDHVEIKASNPRYWGTKVMFQMVSNGSLTLCFGEKYRGTLEKVKLLTLSEVANTALACENIAVLGRNICSALERLKESAANELATGDVFEIVFSGSKLKLHRSSESIHQLFPKKDAVHKLLAIQN